MVGVQSNITAVFAAQILSLLFSFLMFCCSEGLPTDIKLIYDVHVLFRFVYIVAFAGLSTKSRLLYFVNGRNPFYLHRHGCIPISVIILHRSTDKFVKQFVIFQKLFPIFFASYVYQYKHINLHFIPKFDGYCF